MSNETFEREINNLHNLKNKYQTDIEQLKQQISCVENEANTLRAKIAKRYEDKINQCLQEKSIYVVTCFSKKRILLNKNNLIKIESSYPGFQFHLLSGFNLGDYYNYNRITELRSIANNLIEAINTNRVFLFPDAQD